MTTLKSAGSDFFCPGYHSGHVLEESANISDYFARD
jgi:hypothetical protein